MRSAEGGTPLAEVCCQIGSSDAAFSTCKPRHADLGVSELRKLNRVFDIEALRAYMRAIQHFPSALRDSPDQLLIAL